MKRIGFIFGILTILVAVYKYAKTKREEGLKELRGEE